ncbi:acetylglutamate kinase [Adhaeribacter pallidiroseus]|uniref:Acetylglutamate kinase n=1 Tax=Adhaeribacter pallidiroseus TaxID=2072847 RepID=A0A369QI68_9BACT|nr:acetylglutamate kinase [Adhaeribacter pallidiroseus]RDC62926.1 Acetylglutamate kinase [Adhaeribacter pallidiroseus]
METLYIVKIGGNVIDDENKLKLFLNDFSQIPGLKLLVHGGGKIATEVSKALGIEPQLVDGRRITDAGSLRVVTMVYAGLINKNIVAQLQALQCNALGLTGADANLIPAKKRQVAAIDYGFVGDIEAAAVNAPGLQLFLNQGFTPVVAPLTHDKAGNLLNTNADTIASTLAVALASLYQVSLIYCFEKKGVLQNVQDEKSLIPEITPATYPDLRANGIIAQGMIPKMDNALQALEQGVKAVHIAHADDLLLITQQQLAGTVLHL